MDCCTHTNAVRSPVSACPGCGQPGRRVKVETLDALVRADRPRADETYRFCATPGCEVAWFGESSGERLTVADATVRIGQKETAPDRPVCYCFGFTAADITRALRPGGGSPIAEGIAERCRRGEDRCAVTNPQGACCLGNVRAVEKLAAQGGRLDACGCDEGVRT